MIRVRDWVGAAAAAGLYTAAPLRAIGAGWALGRLAGWAVPPPLGRACPCCAVGQAGGPCTTRAFGPCRHGHGGSRAVQPMGRAAGPWAVWKSILPCVHQRCSWAFRVALASNN
jgi:hypothetical protein